MKGKQDVSVYFIGAGPGALDLLTLRALRILRQADLILYADSLVNPEITTLVKPGAEVVGSSGLTLGEIVSRMVRAAKAGQIVARVHSGDPCVFGAIGEQMAALDAEGISYALVPGVSSLFGAAAELGVELTPPEVSQTIIITRAAGRTPVPGKEDLRALAAHQATLAIFLSVRMVDRVVSQLLEGGYPSDTPVAVVHRATLPDQQILRGTLASIAQAVRAQGITRQALILVGEALNPDPQSRLRAASHLYDPAFEHGYRRPSTKATE